MPTIEEVNKFLEEFKITARVFGIHYRDDRRKNTETLFSLGITGTIRDKIVFSLEKEDYSEGPIMDVLNKGADMWVFGKDYNNTEIYIKLAVYNKALVISFHEAEQPIKYPFK